MSVDFLKKIASEKNASLKAKATYYQNLKKNMCGRSGQRYRVFQKAIAKPGQINLIAEIKKASPSAGLLREDFDVSRIAKIYADQKAAAISVLTEEKYFLGKPAYLKTVSDQVQVPTLMKDFIVHEFQIYEGAFCGASAVLLIAAMLPASQLRDLIQTTQGLGLDCLVEVHDEREIDRVMKADADIIGVNNRDLRDLKVDIQNCLRMIPRIPKSKTIVAESGLQSHSDVRRVQEAGAHAVLIGETFMRAADIGAKIREIMYGQN